MQEAHGWYNVALTLTGLLNILKSIYVANGSVYVYVYTLDARDSHCCVRKRAR